MAQSDWEAKIAQIRRERTATASDLVWRITDMMIEAISAQPVGGVETTRRWLLKLSRDVIAAKPAVGLLFSLVNGALWAADRAMSPGDILQAAAGYLADYQANWESRHLLVARQAEQMLASMERVVVHSSDSMVLGALQALAQTAHPPSIYCGEGRPGYQGLALASELAACGIEVTIGVDLALFAWLKRADALLLGCESLSRNGLVGRIGVAPLATAAYERELPVIVLCQRAKLLPRDYFIDVSNVRGEPEQIMEPQDENLSVSNVLLDVAPIETVTAVITEDGVLSGEQLMETLDAIRIYPGLRGT